MLVCPDVLLCGKSKAHLQGIFSVNGGFIVINHKPAVADIYNIAEKQLKVVLIITILQSYIKLNQHGKEKGR
jgi:hypothetical protein